MSQVRVCPAESVDRVVLERLWLLFRHDLSEFRGGLPEPDGTYPGDGVEAALGDGDWACYLLASGDRPVGLALVRGLAGPARVMNGFFVVRGARRGGVGMLAAREVIARHPGPWEVPFQDNNPKAVRFWRRVAAEVAPGAWTEERRPVPDRPQSPPDVWISFGAPAPPRGRGAADGA